MPEQRIGKTYKAAAGAHRELEWFALVCDTEAGVILEQMTASLGHRVDKLRKELSLPHGILEGTLIQLLLLRDTDVMSQGEFDRELEEIKSYKDDVEWTGPERYEEDIKKEEELKKKRSKRKDSAK